MSFLSTSAVVLFGVGRHPFSSPSPSSHQKSLSILHSLALKVMEEDEGGGGPFFSF